MTFFRQYIAPFFIFLIFLLTLALVSSRIFLPADMAAPAPVEAPAAEQLQTTPNQQAGGDKIENSQVTLVKDTVADLPPSLSTLVKGLPDDSNGQF
ncbi:MAG: hypothetical protein ACKO24_05520 [Leptolyngbyaceae cyanobacterium]